MNKEIATINPFLPITFSEALQMAEILAKSNIVPKDYQGSPGNVLVAMQWGAEIGLKPLQAMQNIAIINGRPSLYGDAMLALVRGSGLLKAFSETHNSDQATCSAERVGWGEKSEHTFTKEDAKRAGLWGKSGPWQTYPERMLQMRARAWVLRDLFPDVLKGLSIAEEAQDMPAQEKDITPPRPQKPALAPAGWSMTFSWIAFLYSFFAFF
jgi:hypothetical protein